MTRPPSTMPRPNRIGAFAVQRFVELADAGVVASVAASVVVSVIWSPVGSSAPRGWKHVAAVLPVVGRFGSRLPLSPPGKFRRTLPIGGEVRRYVRSAHASGAGCAPRGSTATRRRGHHAAVVRRAGRAEAVRSHLPAD